MKQLYATLAAALLAAAPSLAQTAPAKAKNHRVQSPKLNVRSDLRAPIAFNGLKQLKTPTELRTTLCNKARSRHALRATTSDIISTQPEGTLHDNFYRSGQSFVYLWVGVMEQPIDGLYGKVVEAADNKTVYIYNPVNSFYTSSWVKATRTQGDTLEVKLPQHIAHVDYSEDGSDAQDAYLYKMKLESVEEDGETYSTFVPDTDQTAKFIYRNDSLLFINTTADSKLLGVADADGSWYGYGDYVSQWGVFNDEPVSPEHTEADVVSQTAMVYDESGQTYGRIVKTTQEDDKYFVQGLNRNMPSAWAKGTADGNKIVFKSKQFMGLDPVTESFTFFQPLGHEEITIDYGDGDVETYTDYCLMDSIVFDFDRDNLAMVSDSSLCVNQGYQQVNQIYTYDAPAFTPWEDKPRTPAAPIDVTYEPYDEDYGYGYLTFVPNEFTDDEAEDVDLLDVSKLYFNVYIDDDVYTFDPDDYTSLTEPLTDIPYDFTDDNQIINYAGQFTIMTYITGFDKIGVQAIYKGGGETRKSEIVYIDLASVKNATADGATPLSTTYTDLLGRSVVKPTGHGVFVKNVRFSDGTVKSVKFVR